MLKIALEKATVENEINIGYVVIYHMSRKYTQCSTCIGTGCPELDRWYHGFPGGSAGEFAWRGTQHACVRVQPEK